MFNLCSSGSERKLTRGANRPSAAAKGANSNRVDGTIASSASAQRIRHPQDGRSLTASCQPSWQVRLESGPRHLASRGADAPGQSDGGCARRSFGILRSYARAAHLLRLNGKASGNQNLFPLPIRKRRLRDSCKPPGSNRQSASTLLESFLPRVCIRKCRSCYS